MQAENQGERTGLYAKTVIRVPDAEGLMSRMLADFEADGAAVLRTEQGADVAFSSGEIRGEVAMTTDANLLSLHVRAADKACLADMKGFLAVHVVEHTDPDQPDFVWTGDGAGAKAYPNMHRMVVERVADITPRMRRVTFSGPGIERYLTGGPHFMLLVPPDDATDLHLPAPGDNGLPLHQPEELQPKSRHYTVRRIDQEQGTMDVDFVLHPGDSVGASWASKAQSGAVAGFYGPLGNPIPEADWYWFVGDETALPVIARMLESLPNTARGVALIEVQDETEEQAIDCAAGIELRWLHRNAAAPGTTSLLIDAVRSVTMPAARTRIHAMAGVEYATFKAIRSYWRRELGLDKTMAWPGIYWRRGLSEDEADGHAASDE